MKVLKLSLNGEGFVESEFDKNFDIFEALVLGKNDEVAKIRIDCKTREAGYYILSDVELIGKTFVSEIERLLTKNNVVNFLIEKHKKHKSVVMTTLS